MRTLPSLWLVILLSGCEPPAGVIVDPFPALPDPDVDRMLLFREDQLREGTLGPTVDELRGHLTAPDHRGQGQGLLRPDSMFDANFRQLEVQFPPGTTPAQVVEHLNAASALLDPPRQLLTEEVEPHLTGGEAPVLSLGASHADAQGELEWEWTLFDPRPLPASALVALVRRETGTIRLVLEEDFLEENARGDALALRLSAWAASMTLPGVESLRALEPAARLGGLLPPFAAGSVNRWPAIPTANCMQIANLILYPRLNRYPMFFFDPMLFIGDVGQTPWREAMERGGAGEQVDEVNDTIGWVHEQVGATGDVDLFELGAPLQTGTVIVVGSAYFQGFINLGHAVTVLGALVEGEGDSLRILDYLVLEKENPGLHAVRIERLGRVLERLDFQPGGQLELFAYTPEGNPLPFKETDPALLHPDA